jgi:hypothetical protein
MKQGDLEEQIIAVLKEAVVLLPFAHLDGLFDPCTFGGAILKGSKIGRCEGNRAVAAPRDLGRGVLYLRKKHGGLEVSEMRRLRQLEEENRRLKAIVAGQTLDLRAEGRAGKKTATARVSYVM